MISFLKIERVCSGIVLTYECIYTIHWTGVLIWDL